MNYVCLFEEAFARFPLSLNQNQNQSNLLANYCRGASQNPKTFYVAGTGRQRFTKQIYW